ncbi:MAG: C69 family dipeptidase [Lachnospiraceae bacterium]|nr:C69 family dipeptidase [Lachnospiraceae bacterium]
MACTTILAGKNATYDGSTMIARNDDSGAGSYTPKKLEIVTPDKQPRHYCAVISHAEIDLPDDPMRYSAVPNALEGEGIWAGAGVNAANVAMTATETIASNARVLGADPLVKGGIGEEDFVTIVLPYIRTAREGVLRTGALLEQYGTYEMNGIAFSDVNEIWWMETIGGHHWIARRVPDDRYVVMPNESGIDSIDLDDALGEGKENLCSADLRSFIADNHLDLSMNGNLNPREAFGTQDDADHVYNTPRAWYMLRHFNPRSFCWDGPQAQYTPMSNDLPWSLVPERKITVEDVKYILSSHYQGTPYDPYSSTGDGSMRGAYRSIGVNRTDFLALLQLRPYAPAPVRAVEWLTFGSNVFNAFVPFYPNTDKVPDYLSNTGKNVDTASYYWNNRLIAALADAQYAACKIHIERYQEKVSACAHEIIGRYDKEISSLTKEDEIVKAVEKANEESASMLKENTADVLLKVLNETSNKMRNAYARSDA